MISCKSGLALPSKSHYRAPLASPMEYAEESIMYRRPINIPNKNMPHCSALSETEANQVNETDSDK